MLDYKNTKPAVMIKTALDVLHEPGEVFEVRVPKTRIGTLSGYFDDSGIAAVFIAKENGKHKAIYTTVNPVKSSLIARANNTLRVLPITEPTTSDAEIERRRWFLLDFDPVRPAGISSTDSELEASKECAIATMEWLASIGWPEPVQACSGNGWHLMYRVDIPNDDTARVDFEHATKMIASVFSSATVSVDTTVFNAARVWKIYGTRTAKGSSTEDRPHRIAHLVKVPDTLTLLTREQIENVARPLRDANSEEFKNMAGEFIGDMVKWLADRGITVTSGPRPLFGNEGQKWTISHCSFNHQHVGPIVGLVNNRPVYRCLHNSCSAFRWKEFREKIDPNYKDPETIYNRLKEWCDGDQMEIDQELIQSTAALGRKVDGTLKRLRKEAARARVLLLEGFLKEERKRYIRETIGDNNEKGNLVGLINRTRSYQAEGIVPTYWIADYDHRIRVGTIGEIECPKSSEADEIALMIKFHSAGDSWVKQTHCGQVIRHLAEEYRTNPLRNWFKQKRWDGTKRLDTWLPHYMGTKDDEYTRAIGRKWMISAVARGMDPGCQADHMLIFEGKQGVGKSRAARILGGQFYTEYSGTVRGHSAQRDMVAVIIGKLIVEMSELATMRKADIESLKAILTTCVDDVRLSYERDAKAYPRTCIFLGTTNEVNGAYIADPTGARRFWPTVVAAVKPVRNDLLATDVDQLWAEAVEAYESGEDWFTVPTDKVLMEQADRQVLLEDSDPWYMKVRGALTDPDSFGEVFHVRDEYGNGTPTGQKIIRASQFHTILGAVLGIETYKHSALDVARVRNILNHIGFRKVRPSKGWLGAAYAYDLFRDTQPHLWPAIMQAYQSAKFPKSKTTNFAEDDSI